MDDESKRDRIKRHFVENKKFYFGAATGIGIAGFSYLITRDIDSQRIDRGISVVADRGISVIADRSVVTNNVSLISSRRKGAPSWVVRCLETGNIFSSQLSAAKEMGLPASEISKQLNGAMENVRGYHFERICMAA